MRRILYMIPLFIGISILVFSSMQMAGDPVQLMTALNPNIPEKSRQLIRAYYGLDKPLYYQYLLWLWRFLHLDLGHSYYQGLPVSRIIGQWTWETLKIQFLSLFLALVISIPVGIMSARKRYSKLDMSVTTVALFGVSTPIFFIGIIGIILFAFYLALFPSGMAHSIRPERFPFGSYILDELWHMALPTIVLTYAFLAEIVILLRSSMLEVLRQDYVLAARASGLSERTVLYKHALRNALIPVVTLTGLYFGASLGGAPITETVFNWPGLGRFFVQAITRLDFPVVQGITMIIAIMILLSNLITDMTYAYIDPRIRIE